MLELTNLATAFNLLRVFPHEVTARVDGFHVVVSHKDRPQHTLASYYYNPELAVSHFFVANEHVCPLALTDLVTKTREALGAPKSFYVEAVHSSHEPTTPLGIFSSEELATKWIADHPGTRYEELTISEFTTDHPELD